MINEGRTNRFIDRGKSGNRRKHERRRGRDVGERGTGGRINGSDRRVDEGDSGRYEEMMDVWEY